jgi:hypothetical protein
MKPMILTTHHETETVEAKIKDLVHVKFLNKTLPIIGFEPDGDETWILISDSDDDLYIECCECTLQFRPFDESSRVNVYIKGNNIMDTDWCDSYGVSPGSVAHKVEHTNPLLRPAAGY